jgi:hypothetical protein
MSSVSPPGSPRISVSPPPSPSSTRAAAFQSNLPPLREKAKVNEIPSSPREKSLGRGMARSKSGVFRERKTPSLTLGAVFSSDQLGRPQTSGGQRPRKMSRTDADLAPRISWVRVGAPLFLKRITERVTEPVISCQEWEEKANRALLEALLNNDSPWENRSGVIKKLFNNLLNYSSILKRVKKAAEFSIGKPIGDILNKFDGKSHPMHFKKEYFPLLAKDKDNIFYEIIGGKEACKIIERATEEKGKKIQEYFEKQIEKFVSSENKRKELLNSSFKFHPGFDLMKPHRGSIPIFLSKAEDVIGAFRSFVSDGPFPEDAIVINKENVKIPNYKDLSVGDGDREEYFTQWMISTLQRKFGIDLSLLSASEQVEVFGATVEKEKEAAMRKLKLLISKHLGDEFAFGAQEHEMPFKLMTCFTKLRQEKRAEDFAHQMDFHMAFLSRYVYLHADFAENQRLDPVKKDWSRIADSLAGLYREAYKLDEKHKKIPLLALYKTISFSAYGPGDHFLSHYLCPDLSPLVNRSSFSRYHLQLNRKFITSYAITKRDEHSFENIHRKRFKIVHLEEKKIEIGLPGQIKIINELFLEKKKAKLMIHWAIEGKHGCMEYGARMEITEFKFRSDCSIEERKLITDRFHLEWNSTPWGHYLQRVVIQRQL